MILTMTDWSIVDEAEAFATKAHEGQVRKYTGEPYIFHPEQVELIVSRVKDVTPAMLAAAWLHDVLEDTETPYREIRDNFGYMIGSYVSWLTNVTKWEGGNRAARNAKDCERLSRAPVAVQTIKYADLIDNQKSIVARDPAFAKVYLAEKAELLKVMNKGDAGLYREALRHNENA